MELDKLQALIDMLRVNGVHSYKDGDLELELGAAPAKPTPAGKEETITKRLVTDVDKALSDLPGNDSALFSVTAGES